MKKKALVPIADGTEEIEAACIIDVLRRAGVAVTVASVMGRTNITASRGLLLTADTSISECSDQTFDLIALPGGMPGAEHLRDSVPLTDMLRSQSAAGRLYAAICASPAVVLEYYGLLDGKKATCYPSFLNQLNSAEAVDSSIVIDGNCITSQGPGTALEFALTLAEALLGADHVRKVAEPMLVKR